MLSSACTETAAASPSVDLMALLGRCLGNMQMVERVLSMFLQTGKADLERLQVATEAADFVTVADVSHRMKGAAGNVSAGRIRELFARAEQLGRQHESGELMLLLQEMHAEWRQFENFARAFGPSAESRTPGPARYHKPLLETSHAGARC